MRTVAAAAAAPEVRCRAPRARCPDTSTPLARPPCPRAACRCVAPSFTRRCLRLLCALRCVLWCACVPSSRSRCSGQSSIMWRAHALPAKHPPPPPPPADCGGGGGSIGSSSPPGARRNASPELPPSPLLPLPSLPPRMSPQSSPPPPPLPMPPKPARRRARRSLSSGSARLYGVALGAPGWCRDVVRACPSVVRRCCSGRDVASAVLLVDAPRVRAQRVT